MISLVPAFQTYHWGNVGERSLVGQALKKRFEEKFMEETHYAELWMGTHSSGPSKVKIERENSSSISP